jgi:hypothetical protein
MVSFHCAMGWILSIENLYIKVKSVPSCPEAFFVSMCIFDLEHDSIVGTTWGLLDHMFTKCVR